MPEPQLSRSRALAYALPSVGLMWTQLLFTNYIFKYAVDVLGIAAASVGGILMMTRLWDAVTDPLVAYLSDSTRARAGRRRPWLLASALPVALTSYFMWNPPLGLEGAGLAAWLFVSVALWETAMTTYFIPYMALGSEITMEHHDRTRVAGYRHVLGGLGQLCVIGSVWLLTRAGSGDAQRDVAAWLLAAGGVAALLLMAGPIWFIQERPEHIERRARRPGRAVRDVLRNRHLLRVAAVYFFEISSIAAVGLLASFVCEYVIGDAALFPTLLLCSQLASYLSTPLVVKLARRAGKKLAWVGTMSVQAAGFAATLLAGAQDGAWLIGCMCVIGLGSAGGHVLGMSLLADAVDYDEFRSGERREGLHYAAINIARKLSFASLSALVGVALGQIGYVAHAAQSPETLRALSGLFAGIPVVGLLLAIALLLPLRLTRQDHERVRAELDARKLGSPVGGA